MAAFSVYDAGKYYVNVIAAADIKPVEIREVELGAGGVPSGAVLPPLVERTDSEFVAMLADANFGLPPAAQEYEVSDYAGGLQLEAIGQPEIAVGADRFGAAIGGGIGFFFSDMLGNQSLATVFQISTLGGNFSWKNMAAQVSYMNKTNRWNWGLVGGQVPYMTGGVRAGIGRDQRRSGLRRGDDHLPPDRTQRGGRRRVSVQPGAPRSSSRAA